LDQGPYNISKETKKKAKELNIELKYLPPYSPNLNPIERLWKVMNEYARNNRFFASAKEFRNAIAEFFDTTWPRIKKSMVDRINDSFRSSSKSNFSF
jgi:transposase